MIEMMSPEERALYMQRNASRFYGRPGTAQSVDDDPPSHFFHLIAEASDYYPHLYDETARQPMLMVLACLNAKRKRERQELERDLEIAKSLAGAGVASIFGGRKRRRR